MGVHNAYRHKQGPEMVVQNFLSPVLSSFLQIPCFSPVRYSNVFSFTFNTVFQILFRLLHFHCSCFPTLFRPYAFLTVPCYVFQSIAIILCQFPRFYLFLCFLFSTFSPHSFWIYFPVLCPIPAV
jgi:hypothetical protein